MMSWVDIMQNAAEEEEEEEPRNIPVQRLEQLYLVVLNIYLSSLISNVNHNFLELTMQNSDKFAISHLYNSTCSYSAKYVRIHPIFMFIHFHHHKQLT